MSTYFTPVNDPTVIVFCQGKGCLLRFECKRYRCGLYLRSDYRGCSWMEACHSESRWGYLPI